MRSAPGGGGSGRGGLRIIDDEADMAALDKRRVNKAWEGEETAGVADGRALACFHLATGVISMLLIAVLVMVVIAAVVVIVVHVIPGVQQ